MEVPTEEYEAYRQPPVSKVVLLGRGIYAVLKLVFDNFTKLFIAGLVIYLIYSGIFPKSEAGLFKLLESAKDFVR